MAEAHTKEGTGLHLDPNGWEEVEQRLQNQLDTHLAQTMENMSEMSREQLAAILNKDGCATDAGLAANYILGKERGFRVA